MSQEIAGGSFFLLGLIIIGTFARCIQDAYFDHLEKAKEQRDVDDLARTMELTAKSLAKDSLDKMCALNKSIGEQNKDLEEYKKKVDALVMKAGLKL